jgi:hypothetical protein
MFLKVSVKLLSEEETSAAKPISNGYSCLIKTYNSPLLRCSFVLPAYKSLNTGDKYTNVGIEILNNNYPDKFNPRDRIYFYVEHNLIAEGLIESKLP